MTFQAWKMVLLNSMTFQEEWSPCMPHLIPTVSQMTKQITRRSSCSVEKPVFHVNTVLTIRVHSFLQCTELLSRATENVRLWNLNFPPNLANFRKYSSKHFFYLAAKHQQFASCSSFISHYYGRWLQLSAIWTNARDVTSKVIKDPT